MRLIDSHCHLQAERFSDDRFAVLAAARDAGVERILVPGWDRASSEAAVALARENPGLDAAVGVHPHDAATATADDWEAIAVAATDPRVVAIGETGLDFDRLFSPREDQVRNLRRNLALALSTGKPAILHCRSAAGSREAQDVLADELVAAGFDDPAAREAFDGRPPAVIHSFSGPVDYAERVLAMGLAISFSGLVFRRGEEPAAEVATLVPADRLLVETDSPFLAPPGAPRRMEPGFVGITAAWLAARRGEAPEDLGPCLVGAYDRLFRAQPKAS